MRYRLICLDAGFTIISPRADLDDAFTGLLAEHGRTPSEEELRRAWEAADRWFWDEYHRPDNLTWADDRRINQTWRAFHGQVLRELGIGEDRMAELVERILAGQFSPESWEAYPDVVPFLEGLQPRRAAGALQIGVVSDWNSNLRDILVALELDRYLDFVLASAAVGLAKPRAEFYRLALERADAPPEQAVMIGDSYRADVIGARAAGMDAVLLDRRGEATAADVPVIRSLLELPPLLEADAAHARAPVEADA